MTIRNVTITSKNQITIPADMVRDMRLSEHRRLNVRKRGNELILSPEPTLENQLQKIWEQLPPFRGTASDEELKRTNKEAWTSKKI